MARLSQPLYEADNAPLDARVGLARTKLRPPRMPARVIAVTRHGAGAEPVLSHAVCLVRAPAGYGKSTLCARWYALLDAVGHATAWVSFEREDDTPPRAIGAILQSLAAALGGHGAARLRDMAEGLSANDGVIVPQALATSVINTVDDFGQPVVLFLDDLDLLSDPRILQFLNYLLLAAPANMHFVLSCQALLALPLIHLEHHGLLRRFGIDDLRLSDAEAVALLDASGPAAASDAVRLNEAMAGWVTGLRIGSAALRNNRDAVSDIGLVGHSARWLSDYLEENIVAHLTPDAQRFLTRCAVVETMNAQLCATLSGLADAGAMLGWLADQNLFVQRLDDTGGWFAIHAVFREFLLARLVASDASAKTELHRLASRWYAAHDRPAEAIGHALDGGDVDAAASLIEDAAMAMVERSDILTLLGWLARLPATAVCARVGLRLAEAWALTLSLRPQARAVLDDLGRRPRTPALDHELAGIETIFLAVYEDRLDAALDHSKVFLARSTGDSFAERAVRNAAAYCETARGNHADVHALVRPAQLGALRHEQIFPTAYRYCVVGLSYRAQAQLGEAERCFTAGLDLTIRRSGPGSASSALLVPFLARCHYERDDLDAADARLAGWLPVVDEACFSESVLNAYHVAVRVLGARGDIASAAALIEHAELLGHERGWQRLLARCMAERARLGLPQTMDADRLLAVDDEPEAITRALSLAARTFAILAEYRAEAAFRAGDHARVSEIGARLGSLATAAGNREWLMLGHVYALLPKLARGGPSLPDACARLSSAAAAAGYRRLLTDVLATPDRAPMPLPWNWPPELTALAPLPSLAAASASAPRTVFELLTSREIDVLTGVSSGESNKDIARRLHLTPETVKWHLKNVMRKLDAISRTDAVARAATLGLALAV